MAESDAAAAIQEAHTLLSDVQSFKEVGVSDNTAVSRLYYACFHAARSVMYDRGIPPKSHDGMKGQIGEELVLPGDISKEDGSFYSNMCDYRDRADYVYHSVPADVDVLFDRTEEFVETMEALLDGEPIESDEDTDDSN